MRKIWGAAGLAAIALTVAACGSSGSTAATGGGGSTAVASGAAAAAAGGALSTTTIGGTTVLTNSAGLTLYWFAPDSSTASKCYGQCASYWPPVKGPATAGSGVTGKLGTITRSDGSMQVTYDGHPLYTYLADTAPGQAKGNNLNASGGLWYEMTVSGAKATAAGAKAPASSPSAGSGGGYGY